jgi:membrane protein DedA with SNARE-associated domain
MSPSIALFIIDYGYLAIFTLILLQELGAPIPVFNEFLLLFFGYLAFTGDMELSRVLITAAAASMLGAWILYGIFFFAGTWIMSHPRLPFRSFVEKLEKKISVHAFKAIFIGRLVPFGRGYICIAAGIMKIDPRKFAQAIAVSDIFWTGSLILLGFYSGPLWMKVAEKIGGVENILLIAIVVFITYVGCRYAYSKHKSIYMSLEE